MLSADEVDLLTKISRYDGADRTRHGTPDHDLALVLEDKGMIKVVDLGDTADLWKMTDTGLKALIAA